MTEQKLSSIFKCETELSISLKVNGIQVVCWMLIYFASIFLLNSMLKPHHHPSKTIFPLKQHLSPCHDYTQFKTDGFGEHFMVKMSIASLRLSGSLASQSNSLLLKAFPFFPELILWIYCFIYFCKYSTSKLVNVVTSVGFVHPVWEASTSSPR